MNMSRTQEQPRLSTLLSQASGFQNVEVSFSRPSCQVHSTVSTATGADMGRGPDTVPPCQGAGASSASRVLWVPVGDARRV